MLTYLLNASLDFLFDQLYNFAFHRLFSAPVATTSDVTTSPGKQRRGRGPNKSKLPKTLQGLMGEANMKFARGEYEQVIVMCKEVIRSGLI